MIARLRICVVRYRMQYTESRTSARIGAPNSDVPSVFVVSRIPEEPGRDIDSIGQEGFAGAIKLGLMRVVAASFSKGLIRTPG
jgi:hypothetical protein